MKTGRKATPQGLYQTRGLRPHPVPGRLRWLGYGLSMLLGYRAHPCHRKTSEYAECLPRSSWEGTAGTFQDRHRNASRGCSAVSTLPWPRRRSGPVDIELGKPIKNRFRKSCPKRAVVLCRLAKIRARYRHDALFLHNSNSRIYMQSANVSSG